MRIIKLILRYLFGWFKESDSAKEIKEPLRHPDSPILNREDVLPKLRTPLKINDGGLCGYIISATIVY